VPRLLPAAASANTLLFRHWPDKSAHTVQTLGS
jgi:hypothetical protein